MVVLVFVFIELNLRLIKKEDSENIKYCIYKLILKKNTHIGGLVVFNLKFILVSKTKFFNVFILKTKLIHLNLGHL